ncbi:hypothetical protein HPP92_024736 [Vanilla planifolia]|uniref:Uncharacterized protein n=1 Tax=Vanilla planifolia TaxID=51239 RepID=A0A835PNM0_VANPL|nr:hypothetical protein HPP92_024736 [Vanilla planifolia]
MGNTLVTTACFQAPSQDTQETKLVFYGGATQLLPGRRHLAGELMFQSPDSIVCHAGSFFIGQPLPVLSIDDELLGGETYFVIPADRLPCSVLTAASLAALSSNRGEQKRAAAQQQASGCSPFEYVKGEDGRAHIKVMPEFITRMISFNGGEGEEGEMEEGGGGVAALRRRYAARRSLGGITSSWWGRGRAGCGRRGWRR